MDTEMIRALIVLEECYRKRYWAIAPARWNDPRIPQEWQAALLDAAVVLGRPITDAERARAVARIPLTY